MRLLDIAPTLLELSGRPVPASMQGQSLRQKSRAAVTV
jgi:bisphosphoglycerate-independent phosphoglycerate mutase (AlkP superfamily)